MSNSTVFAALLWAFFCYLLVSLIRNYFAAKALGIPVILCPFDIFHAWWYLWGGLIRPIVLLFPYRLRRWASLYRSDWPFHDKGRIHREIGDVFAIVNPWNFAIVIADPVGADAVYHRRRDFVKGPNYSLFNFFGKNVFSVNGEDWARQRKITGPCFNERVSSLVWDEAVRQAHAAVKQWMSQPNGIVYSMQDDTRTIALHVLSAVGFDERQEFGRGMADIKAGHQLTYKDAVVGVLRNIGQVIVFPRSFFDLPLVPRSTREAGTSLRELDSYMSEMLNDERQAMESGEAAPAEPNLLSAMIRSSAEERNPKARLTDQEIKGNLFIFNIAGHDTTANTLAYAITLLALNQDTQAWLREELKQHVRGQEKQSYENTFRYLIRCEAVMWETLRLYPPVLAAPRMSYGPQSIPLSDNKSLAIPAGTMVHLNHYGVQVSPAMWSADKYSPLEFRPERWIKTSAVGASGATLMHPRPGAFLAWSSGPRICLGMKFSQVEFVAVLSAILADHIVEPAGTREDLETALRTTTVGNPTLTMSGSVVIRLRENVK